MMKTAINMGFYARYLDIKKAAEYISKAGFTHLDYTPPLRDDNWESIMKEAKNVFDSYGLTVHQTHAPFNRYGKYGDRFKVCMDRCVEVTSYFGAEYIAVHGDEFDFENMTFSEDAALEYNYNLFKPYVEQAEKSGYKLAFETVFEDGFKNRRRYTSKADELLGLIKAFDSKSAVCCWDFGHAHVAFKNTQADEVLKLGSLIECTHLHDNCGNDSHQMPMTGDIDWKAVMGSFGKIGYNGVMSVEYAHGTVPEIFVPDYLKLTYDITQHLCEMM